MKKYPLLTKYFISFSLFLTIPLIIAGALFNYNMINYSQNEISKSGIGKLKVIKGINDLMTDSVSKVALRLSVNGVMDRMFTIDNYSKALRSSNDIITISETLSILSEITRSDSKLQSVYLYLDNADFILTTNAGVVSKADFKDLGWNEEYKKGLFGQNPEYLVLTQKLYRIWVMFLSKKHRLLPMYHH